MSTQEKSRQNIAEQRQHQQHLQRSMLERSAAEVGENNETEIQEEARELLAKQLQKEHHKVLSMKSRAEEEIE